VNGLLPVCVAIADERWGGGLVRVFWVVEATLGQKTRQGAQGAQELSAVGVADLTAILVIGAVADIMVAVFDAPLASGDLEQPLCIGVNVRQGRQTGDRQNRFVTGFPAFEIQELPVDAHHLVGAIESDFLRADRQGPQGTVFQAAVVLFSALRLRRLRRGEKRLRAGAAHELGRWAGCP